MDAKKKRLEDDVKNQIVELREKKWKEKADQKRQEELDRERWEEEVQKEADQKKQEDLKHLKKRMQAHWVDIDRVSSVLSSMVQN